MATSTVHNTLLSQAGKPLANIVGNIVLLDSEGNQLTSAFHEEVQIAPENNVRTSVQGTWQVELYANSDISPAGTYYQVTHTIPDEPDQVTTFIVPDDGGEHALATLVT